MVSRQPTAITGLQEVHNPLFYKELHYHFFFCFIQLLSCSFDKMSEYFMVSQFSLRLKIQKVNTVEKFQDITSIPGHNIFGHKVVCVGYICCFRFSTQSWFNVSDSYKVLMHTKDLSDDQPNLKILSGGSKTCVGWRSACGGGGSEMSSPHVTDPRPSTQLCATTNPSH